MEIKKITLPYDHNVFEPLISEETFSFHYGKHYASYINKLNALIKGTEFSSMSLKEIVEKSSGNTFNNAAQVWNHEFYWLSISKDTSENEKNIFLELTKQSEQNLKNEFLKHAASLFGSGWCWLVKDENNRLKFINTQNAETPIRSKEYKPLFVCDVWEHAYYVDYRNDRPSYLNNFWKLINWDFVNKNFSH